MIFYTLFGPTSKLEIHNDKLKLMRNPFLGFFHRKDRVMEFKLDELTQFNITEPKFVWGKIECASVCGKKADFRFTTNAVMMGKIEKYLNTLIVKNEKRNNPEVIELKVTEAPAPTPAPVGYETIEVVNNVLPFVPKEKIKAKKEKSVINKKKIKNRKVA